MRKSAQLLLQKLCKLIEETNTSFLLNSQKDFNFLREHQTIKAATKNKSGSQETSTAIVCAKAWSSSTKSSHPAKF